MTERSYQPAATAGVDGNSGEAILIADAAGAIQYASPGAGALLGYDPRTLHTRDIRDVFPRYDEQLAGPVAADGKTAPAEVAFRHRDETELPAVVHTEALGLAGNRYIVLHARGRERSRSSAMTADEAARRATERDLRNLVSAAFDAIVVHDGERICFVNPSALALVGANSSQELLGRPVMELVAPESRAFVAERMRRVFAGDSASGRAEEVFLRLDGTRFDAEVVGVPVTYGGRPAIQVICRDITESKRARELVRSQREQYRTLVEQTSAILWEGDPETFRFTFVSREAEALLGYPTRRWLEEPDFWVSHMHPEDREWAPQYCARATAERRQHSFDYRMIAADGRIVWLRDVVSVLVDEHNRPSKLVGVMLDITETKQTQAALVQVAGLQRALVEVSQRFMSLGASLSDAQVIDALARVGAHCGVERGYVLRFCSDGDALQCTQQWRAPTTPTLDGDVPRISCSSVPELVRALERREPVIVPSIAELDDVWHRERALLQKRNVRSLIVVPIAVGATRYGCIGYETVTADRHWDDEEVRLLQVLADLLGAAIQRDTAERALRKSEGALAFSEARYRSVINHIREVVFQTDGDGRLTLLNPAWQEITGYRPDDCIGRALAGYLCPSARMYAEAELAAVTHGSKDYCRFEADLIARDGEARCIEVNARRTRDEHAPATELSGTLRDVTEQRDAERRIAHLAHYDPLTDLPNRTLALDRLDRLLRSARRSGLHIGVIYLDIDHFKKVNDTLGHEAGDRLLNSAARRLHTAVRNEDTVARLGGDEFLVLLAELGKAGYAETVAQYLLERFREPFALNGRELMLTASLGIAVAPDDGETAEELLRNADIAMYQSKTEGRNTHHFFNEAMTHGGARRLAIEERLRGALELGELYVLFQPVIDLADNTLSRAEALLRWHSPSLGQVDPEEFIPVAEQSGLIDDIGGFVLEAALQYAARWRLRTGSAVQVSVNVSPQQFREARFVDRVAAALERTGLPGDALEIEITEGVLFSGRTHVGAALHRLRALGVGIAMDDFGTGYASLSHLREYPFDTLKIDKSFVLNCNADANDRELVVTSLRLAQALGLRAIAEGVETEDQLALLRDAGCRFAQGFLFSQPVTGSELAEQIEAHGIVVAATQGHAGS